MNRLRVLYFQGPILYRLLAFFILSIILYWKLPITADAFCFEEAAKEYGINHRLLKSIAQVESNLNPKAININKNGTEDIGLMQINSWWFNVIEGLNRQRLLEDPCYNTLVGAMILRHCIEQMGYTWQAVGCYNARSEDKKKRYAWKVYRVLLDHRPAQQERQQTVRQTTGGFQTLFFSVRDWE